MAKQPILLLAFANDREGTFLRNISREHDAILQALNASVAEVISIPAASADRITSTFREHRDAIKGFHYGGHADGDNLLLDSAGGFQIDAGGFADFLASQKGLKFAFLNGCSTLEQAKQLSDSGIEHVIVTNRAINDESAMKFAAKFYASLASGADVPTCFKEAVAEIRIETGGETRSLFWEKLEEATEENPQPWEIFSRNDVAQLWNLNESDVGNLIEEVKKLISNDRLEKAFEMLSPYLKETDEDLHGQLLLLERKYKDNKKQIRMQIISKSEADLAKNQVTFGLVDLLGEINPA